MSGMAKAAAPRLMEFMTIKEVEETLRQTQTVIVPVGCVEQHGWHLPLSTDIYNATEVAQKVSLATGCLVAPVMPYSYSGGNLPGTINIAPQTISAVINDICRSLAQQGFRNIVVLLGHGGTENLRGIRDGLDVCLRTESSLAAANVALVPFYELSPTIMEFFKQKDFHAGAFETSLMLYWHPELVGEERVTDETATMAALRQDQDSYQKADKGIDHPMIMPRIRQNPHIRIGVMGDPTQARAELGERMCTEVVAGVIDLIRQMEAA